MIVDPVPPIVVIENYPVAQVIPVIPGLITKSKVPSQLLAILFTTNDDFTILVNLATVTRPIT